jgi:hypothetical protein
MAMFPRARFFIGIALGLAGLAAYVALAGPAKEAPAPLEALVIATCSSNGEHSPCG